MLSLDTHLSQMTTESILLHGKHGLQFLFSFGLKWSVLLFVNKILSISFPPVTCTADIYINKESGALGGIPSVSDLSVAGGPVLVFKLPQITQAERQGERTEPKSLRPFSAADKGQRALFGRRCDAFHAAVAPLPRKHSPSGGQKTFQLGGWGQTI